MELLSNVFLGCFIFGLVFTVASFLVGSFGDLAGGHGGGHDVHIGHGGHTHAGHAHTGHGHEAEHAGDKGAEGLGWFNFNALIIFLTWFGGAGFVLTKMDVNFWLILTASIAIGIVGYALVLLFLSKVLYSSQTPFMQDSDYNPVGTVGRISSTIFQNGTGEIIYTKAGTRRNASARSMDGRPLARDTEVVVMRYENGVAYVEEFNKLLNDDASPPPSSQNTAVSQTISAEQQNQK